MSPATMASDPRTVDARQNSSHLWHGLILVAVFAASRVLFSLQGGSFIATPLLFAKQYLDPVLLKNDLLQSLWYLHAQPPLFNLMLGVVLKLSPVPALSYELLFRTAGALIPLLLYGVLAGLGLQPLLALAVAVLFMLNPTLLLYESLLYYTYVEIFLVLLAIFFLVRWLATRRTHTIILFWLALLCLGMIRSLFHPGFLLLAAVVLGWALHRSYKNPGLTRRFLLSSAWVLTPLVILCLKNALLYGFLGTSSWDGMSLWIKTNGCPPEQLAALNAQGIISSTALQAGLDPFQPISQLLSAEALAAIPCHHPADCQEWRSTGKPNFNHSGYVALSRQLKKDALALISHDPGLFAFYTLGSYGLTLWHSSDSVHGLFQNNMEILHGLEKVYRFLHGGFLGAASKQSTPGIWIRTAALTMLFLLFYGSTGAHLRRLSSCSRPEVLLVCLFCLLMHGFTLAVSCLMEFGENNRFRSPVDAALVALMAGNVTLWMDRWGKRRQQSG